MSNSAFKPRTVTCPACGGLSVYGPDNEFRPFCSARCKHHDFGAWSSESYRVETKPEPTGNEPGESFMPT